MIINEISCKTALSPSSLPGLDYSLNPYRGCQHNCAYCYVPNVLRIQREDWGSFVDVKINIPLVLSKELKRKNLGTIGLSTVTDPYQPIEKKYKLTRLCLEQLLKFNFPITIQTKSNLIKRDLDLIQRLENIEVMVSIGTLNDKERKKIEPYASSINERLQLLKKSSDLDIQTSVFFGPIYPTIKLDDIPNIIDCFLEYGVLNIMVDKFNLKPGILNNVSSFFPHHKHLIKDINHYKRIYNEIIRICRGKNIKVVSAF